MNRNRKGFTLIELLVVMAITSVVLLAIGRFAPRWWADLWLSKGAQGVHAQILESRSAAISGYRRNQQRVVGFRMIPDPFWPLVRLPGGAIDRTAPIAYARTVPLVAVEQHRAGIASIHADGWPAGFTPATNRLVLEQS